MREFDEAGKIKDATHQEAKQQKEFKLVGSIKAVPGLKLWQYNLRSHELSLVEITKKAQVNYDSSVNKNARVQYNPDCVYLQALNEKNAKKKVNKMIAEKIIVPATQYANASRKIEK